MTESSSTRAKLALSDLKIEGQKVFVFETTHRTYSDETGREETLRGDLELKG